MDISPIGNVFVCAFIIIVALNVTVITRKTKDERSVLILTVLVSFTFIFISLPTAIFLPILWIYREIIRFYLKIKYGVEFAGLIEGADVINMCNKTENSLVSVLLMFECTEDQKPEDVYENFKDIMDKHLIQNRDKLTKYHTVVKYCLGYFYMLRQYVTIDDCVKKMETVDSEKDELTREELITLITKCNNEPLPKNNTVTWDIYVGLQPVNWKPNARPNVKYYPALYRLHHAISDGFDFVQLLAGVIADKSNENSKEAFLLKLKKDSLLGVILHHVAISVYAFIYFSSQFLLENFVAKKDRNILHGPKLSNTDVMAIKVDNGKYLRKIKDMKNELPGTCFSDILLTAFSASISEYFQKHSAEQPDNLKFVLPFLRKATILPQVPVGQLTINEISCHNSFALLSIDLPVYIENKNIFNEHSTLLKRLMAIKKETKRSFNSVDTKVMYFWTHIGMQLFPFPLQKTFYDMLEWTAALSVLPGPPKLILGNGKLPIYDVVFWVPHLASIGCNFSMLTYDNRLQLGLNIDRALIPSHDHAQSILDGVFKYLDLLENEIGIQK